MYCTRSDIEQIFGKLNVKLWADLDNSGDSADIASRISFQITQAGHEVNGDLSSSPYEVPFESPYPDVIVYLCALKAGELLYAGRRVVSDEDRNQVSAQQKLYEKLVRKLQRDQYKLIDVTRVSNKTMEVVKDSDEESNEENCF